MIRELLIFDGIGTDPYQNLATERYLLEHLKPGQYILYLWQNQNTVVIGRNQNPWIECRISLLEQEGGCLARRLSGGGAVFHDLGNLNFTFFSSAEDHDLDKQIAVIVKACAKAGISVEKSGRNDLLAQGRKFSGNAFYHSQGNSYHHGTLLIDTDLQKLQRYLSPSKAKLEAKGVTSVRSRVINLRELSPRLTVAKMRKHMRAAFAEIFGLPLQPLSLDGDAPDKIRSLAAYNSSWVYLFGNSMPFRISFEQQFSWGGILVELDAKAGRIKYARVYSDAMDWNLPAMVESAFTGCCFTKEAMIAQLQNTISDPDICADLCQMVAQQDI